MLLDIFITLLVGGGIALGFWRGLLVQMLIIPGIYLGALLARFIYDPIARSIAGLVTFDLTLLQAMVFLLIVVLVPVLLLLLVHVLWGTLRLSDRWGQLDLLGGTLLGGVTGLLAALLVVLAVGFLVMQGQQGPGGTTAPLLDQVRQTWETSRLRAPAVQLGHLVYYSLLPDIGTGVPAILRVFAPR